MVSNIIIDNSQVNVSQKLSSNISYFLVLSMVFNGFFVEHRVNISQFHVVNAYAIVGESLSMNITNGFADLQKLLVLLNGLFILP